MEHRAGTGTTLPAGDRVGDGYVPGMDRAHGDAVIERGGPRDVTSDRPRSKVVELHREVVDAAILKRLDTMRALAERGEIVAVGVIGVDRNGDIVGGYRVVAGVGNKFMLCGAIDDLKDRVLHDNEHYEEVDEG